MHHFLKRKNSLIFLWKAQKVSDFSYKITTITTYTYKVNKSQVSVKKTEGIRRDCNADDIQKVEAVTYKKFLLDTLTDKTLTEL